jgi:hypothetical protein
MTKNSGLRKAHKPTASARRNDANPDEAGNAPLNFKVSPEFRREFKTYAAQHNKKLKQLLYESFAALKANHDE